MAIDKKFVEKFSKVTSKAALAASYLVGKKDKISIKSFLNALNIAQKFSQE